MFNHPHCREEEDVRGEGGQGSTMKMKGRADVLASLCDCRFRDDGPIFFPVVLFVSRNSF